MSRRNRSHRVLPVALLAMLFLIPAAMPAVTPPPIGEMNPSVIDAYLVEVMASTPPGEKLEIVVRFVDDVTRDDRELVDDLGIGTIGEFHIVPAIHGLATPLQVERLSGYARTEWIEYNEPIVYYMDETTSVVNATNAWRSVVEGSLWGDKGIDGTGVTAVVVDTGVDAGHPDLDYGTKTIRNLKSDTGSGPWYEIENGDTSSGHGTHCAGTIAGNGDASAGSRAGMAPGANLIGLSTGEAGAITGAVGGLQWVYDHSALGNNPYNIRVVSNSWGGGGGQYDPTDTISDAINKLVYENNVAVCFAAGNSAGTGDTIQSSNYGNTPSAINVAASGRDGSYITSFSSRGMWNWTDTWPDFAAPGHYIESTAARRTQISAMTQQGDSDPYYLAISGTSMATPHVSGLVALLWQAAPSMRVSEVRQDAGEVILDADGYRVDIPVGYGNLYYDTPFWLEEALDTRIHETELIIKLTTDYIPAGDTPDPEAHNLTDTFVPDWNVPGVVPGRQHDWSQGYGLINANRAVGLALTLERIRWDHPEATVLDAYTVFENIFEVKEIYRETDRLATTWSGEWSRFNEQSTHPGLVFSSPQEKLVYVPEGAEAVHVTLSWAPFDATKVIAGTLGWTVDFDDNGGWDDTSPLTPELDGTRTQTYQVSSNDGGYWRFGIQGYNLKWHRIIERKQFQEARVEYDMGVSITFPQGYGTIAVPELDTHAAVANLRFAEPTNEYTVGNISMVKPVYNINNVSWSPEVEPPIIPLEGSLSWWWLVVLLIIIAIVAYGLAKFWPESTGGRLVRRIALTVGIVWLLDRARGVTRRGLSLVKMPSRKGRPVKAELVSEDAAAEP